VASKGGWDYMMKCLRLFLLIIIVGLVGCTDNAVDDNEVLDLLKTYKTEQYTIVDPSNPPTNDEIVQQVKPYLSEEALEKLIADRVFSIAPDIASSTNKPIMLNDVQIEKDKIQDDGTVDYTYTLEIQSGEDSNSEVIKINGQLTVSSKDGLKITRDWEELDKLKKFY
jgi:hypothetical protein